MKERFKDIEGYEGYYQVSNLGRVKSLNRYVYHGHGHKQKLLKGVILSLAVKHGYNYVTLYIKNAKKHHRVNRLVAIAFIPNYDNKLTVNHKNGIKTDNNVTNLQWLSHQENIKHGWETGLTNNNHLKKKVAMLNLNGEVISVFESANEASRISGVAPSNISFCCNKKGYHKTAGGYKWKYI